MGRSRKEGGDRRRSASGKEGENGDWEKAEGERAGGGGTGRTMRCTHIPLHPCPISAPWPFTGTVTISVRSEGGSRSHMSSFATPACAASVYWWSLSSEHVRS